MGFGDGEVLYRIATTSAETGAHGYPSAERMVLMCDNLGTHTPAALWAFALNEARRLAQRFKWHHTPKHGAGSTWPR